MPSVATLRRRLFAMALLGALPAAIAPGAAQGPSVEEAAPRPLPLGVAANWSQGQSERAFEAATRLGIRHFRAGIYWDRVERRAGDYRFDLPQTAYPGRLPEAGADLVLTIGGGNPLYDDGHTPYSPAALAAFGRFVAAVAARYPAITAVEIGNEVNAQNFVTGPVKDAGLAERGRYHVAMVEAAAAAVKAVRPEVAVLGGATHSLPGGFLEQVFAQGGAQAIEGLAVHPYTTPIDQLPAQIGALRRQQAIAQVPLYVTEFGSSDPELAPDQLLRGYATLASLGARGFYWYPLTEVGDGMQPLFDRDLRVTETGEAFAFIAEHLAPRAAREISPDRFTFVHAFGDDALVLWGAPRTVRLARGGIAAYDARGKPLAGDELRLDPERPVILLGAPGLALGRDVILGCSDLLADTFYQFAYDSAAQAGAFVPGLTVGGEEDSWQLRPGQQSGGVPWNPYLGSDRGPLYRLTAEQLLLGPGNARGGTATFRYRAETGRQLALAGAFEFPERLDADGEALPGGAADIRLAAGERQLQGETVRGQASLARTIDLAAGETLTVTIAPAPGSPARNLTYRLSLRDPAACRAG